MRVASSLIVLFGGATQIEAGCSSSRPSDVDPNDMDASHRSDPLAIPLEAVAPAKPTLLAEGEMCRGTLSILMPRRGSNEMPSRGCYPPGELDKSYTPGMAGPEPSPLNSAPSSVIRLDAEELDALGAKNVSDLSEFLPELEIQSPDNPPGDPSAPE